MASKNAEHEIEKLTGEAATNIEKDVIADETELLEPARSVREKVLTRKGRQYEMDKTKAQCDRAYETIEQQLLHVEEQLKSGDYTARELKKQQSELNRSQNQLEEYHRDYHNLLDDSGEKRQSMMWLEEKIKWFQGMADKISKEIENLCPKDFEHISVSETSITTRSKATSLRSKSSMTSSAVARARLLEEKTKKIELEEELKFFEEEQAQQNRIYEEERAQQNRIYEEERAQRKRLQEQKTAKRKLEIKKKLAIAKATEKAVLDLNPELLFNTQTEERIQKTIMNSGDSRKDKVISKPAPIPDKTLLPMLNDNDTIDDVLMPEQSSNVDLLSFMVYDTVHSNLDNALSNDACFRSNTSTIPKVNYTNSHTQITQPDTHAANPDLDSRVNLQSRPKTNVRFSEPEIPANSSDLMWSAMGKIADAQAMAMLPPDNPDIFDGTDIKLFPAWLRNFEDVVEAISKNPAQRIRFLEKYTAGAAWNVIKKFKGKKTDEDYKRAKDELKFWYGDASALARKYKRDIKDYPFIRNDDDGTDIMNFAHFVSACYEASKDTPAVKFDDEDTLQQLMLKLPSNMRKIWSGKSIEHYDDYGMFPSFSKFVDFVVKQARLATFPVFGTGAVNTIIRENQKKTKNEGNRKSYNRPVAGNRVKVHKTQIDEHEVATESCDRCEGNHGLNDCSDFDKLVHEDKIKFIMKHGLCFGCLKRGHLSKECPQKLKCKLCNGPHPSSIHNPNYRPKKKSYSSKPNQTVQAGASSLRTKTSSLSNIDRMILVELFSKHRPMKKIQAYAIIDEQSDASFVLEDVRIKLGLPEVPVDLKLATMTSSGMESVRCNKIEDLMVRSVSTKYEMNVPCYTQNEIPHSREQIMHKERAHAHPFLKEIAHEIPRYLPTASVCLLIGTNCKDAFLPSEMMVDPDKQCYGVKTKLGWGIVGFNTAMNEADVKKCNRLMTSELCKEKEVELLKPDDVIKCLERDFIDRNLKTDQIYEKYGIKKTLSVEDKVFLEKCTSKMSTTKDLHLQMPLPFRHDDVQLPDNYDLAYSRLQGVKRKLEKNKEYKKMYVEFMNNLFDNDYAEEVNIDEVEKTGRIWYLPHFGVQNPHKPNKIRVVFDCAATYEGHSLNKELLTGPDLSNNMIGVLIRFRQKPIAVIGDIVSMFYQIRMEPDDRNFLRFLWWKKGDTTKKPTVYRMNVHPFGAASSPGCANLALKTVANMNMDTDLDAAKAVKENCYVDDMLLSFWNEEDAIRIVQDTKKICEKNGFEMSKFISNSREVLKTIDPDKRAKEIKTVNLDVEPLPISRALGVQWRIEDDEFSFSIDLKDNPLTRRGILGTVCSMYDPFGLIAPVTLKCKGLLREICEESKDWDSEVTDELKMKWSRLRNELFELRKLRIKRCFQDMKYGKVIRYELHHFSDGSEVGYGQCTYLRKIHENGDITCSFVMGKSRVTPIAPTTIPRVELTAALTSVKVAKLVQEELEYKIDQNMYWTDSQVVIGYISNKTKRFKQFVSNRVHEIQESTKPSDWKFVNGKENPADDASRGLSVKKLLQENHRYLHGPEFLRRPIEFDNLTEYEEVDLPEVKVLKVEVHEVLKDPLYEKLQEISTWTKMTRFVVIMTKFKDYLVKKHRGDNMKLCDMNLHDIKCAELDIVRILQKNEFKEEIKNLKNKRDLKKASALYKLNPFIDRNNILRLGGRLQNCEIPFEIKHPILIPKKSYITNVIIRYFHDRSQHQGRGFTLQEIRSSGYWIIHGMKTVVNVIRKCVKCRRLRHRTQTQLMANLPSDRLNITTPFSYSAMDAFGPFIVKNRRSEIKRYGLIFTCMASRAIRLEVLPDMTTDSFINALRRFICRNGPVIQIRCDCGSNFIGAANELNRERKKMIDMKSVKENLLRKECDLLEFKFNVPHASHQGGAWERQIRTVRSVLNSILDKNGRQLNDDSLNTMMIEAETIVNSKPLSYENLNSEDIIAITPNQLLTTKCGVIKPPPGKFETADKYGRKYWRRVQHLVEEFWKRWSKEYRNGLQKRSKWNKVEYDIKVGDIVMVAPEETRNEWKLARVIKTYEESDGHVRKVRIRLAISSLDKHGKPLYPATELERPIHKLKLLVEHELK